MNFTIFMQIANYLSILNLESLS